MSAPVTPSKKKSLPSGEIGSFHSPPKQIQTRSSIQSPAIIPTPSFSTRSGSAQIELDDPPYNPACPGTVRDRHQNVLSKLPRDSNTLDTFDKLRVNNDLSDEEAFLKFITSYDVPLSTLNQISTSRLPASLSKVKYGEVASYVWLNPNAEGKDILQLETFRSRIPNNVFRIICKDIDRAMEQYGRLEDHNNEEARSRFISSLFTEIVSLFGNAIVNNLEGLLDAEFTVKGRIEHHFVAIRSISIVFIEVKKSMFVGRHMKLDLIAQVLAQCAACDYANSKINHWVPILAILCDGERFEFLVYDSGTKLIYTSGVVTGLVDRNGKTELYIMSIKETVEYLLDFFMMAYINGIRSFGHNSEMSTTHLRSKKRVSTAQWIDALAMAERAHLLLRDAAILASNKKIKEAEDLATDGIEQLRQSVSQLPEVTTQKILEACWDGNKCIEMAFE